MNVAIITPYYKENTETLARCHVSVASQTYKNVFHVMIADGHPNAEIDEWNVVHIKGPQHSDFGDTPRLIGSISAISTGADALCFLDADNWFEPDHVEQLLRIYQETRPDVVTATRNLRRTDGSLLGVCIESDGEDFNDTNCFFLTKPAYTVLMTWVLKDPREAILGDRVFWAAVLDAGFTRAHCATPTVNYTTTFARHYQQFGETPSPNSKVIVRVKELESSLIVPFEVYERFRRNSGVLPTDPPAPT